MNARVRGAWVMPVIAYAAVWASLSLVVGLSVLYLPVNPLPGSWSAFPRHPWLGGWCRWDAGWYRDIAERGYSFTPGQQSGVAFFPVYPLLMRAGAALGLPTLVAGVAVTTLSGLLAAALFYRWSAARLAPGAARAALLVLLLYPFAYYLYGAVYSDALFLLGVLASFQLLEADRPALAGLCGAVATATRPVGPALVLGLAARALERRGRLRRVRPVDATVLLSALGFTAYCAWLWYAFGDPFAFARAMGAPGWEQPPGPATWFKLALVKELTTSPFRLGQVLLAAHVSATLAAFGLVPRATRRFGWAYGLYALAVLAIPAVSSKDLFEMGRYVLAAFPCFGAAGDLLAPRPRLYAAALGGSMLLLAVLTSLYARWYFVS